MIVLVDWKMQINKTIEEIVTSEIMTIPQAIFLLYKNKIYPMGYSNLLMPYKHETYVYRFNDNKFEFDFKYRCVE